MSSSASWRRNVAAATVASFIGFTGFTLVMPFLPLYLQQLGLEDLSEVALWAGLSLGITPAMTAILSPLWGRLADRFGRKIMVERSIASFVVIMAAMAYVTEPWHVFALRAVQGLFAGYGALALTMAAESAPPDKVPAAIGTVQTAQRLGPALGPLIGGVIAQVTGIRHAFLVSAGFFAVALLLVFVLYREQETERTPAGRTGGSVSFRDLLAFENFLLLMLVIFVVQIVDRSFGPILPLYLVQLGVNEARVAMYAGILFSAAAFAAAGGNQLTGRLMMRWSPRALLVSSSIVCAAGAAVYAARAPVGMLFAVSPLFGIGVGVAMTTAYSTGSALIPRGSGGTGFGLLTTASLAGLALSPMLSGLLAATSIRAVFAIDALAMLLLAAWVRRTMIERRVDVVKAPVVEES
jgi:MFS family permease